MIHGGTIEGLLRYCEQNRKHYEGTWTFEDSEDSRNRIRKMLEEEEEDADAHKDEED